MNGAVVCSYRLRSSTVSECSGNRSGTITILKACLNLLFALTDGIMNQLPKVIASIPLDKSSMCLLQAIT